MFLRNIANFLSSSHLDTKWSTLHHKANTETNNTSESFMLENWKQIKNPAEFKTFIEQHKAQNYAFLLSDYRHRPVLIHHVSHQSDNIFFGISGDNINSIPSESTCDQLNSPSRKHHQASTGIVPPLTPTPPSTLILTVRLIIHHHVSIASFQYTQKSGLILSS